MKKVYFLTSCFIFSLFFAVNLNAQTTYCDTAQAFCTGQTTTFPASTSTVAPNGPNYGCLFSQPNPAFFFLQIDQNGPIDIAISNSSNVDVDFICWGPFTSLPNACASGLTGNAVDCSYSAAANETCNIPNAQNGQVYVLLITNYSGSPTNISFQQSNPGTGNGSTNCNIVNNCAIQSVTAVPGACSTTTNSFNVSGLINYNNHPTNSGSIIITDNISGVSQLINSPFPNTIGYNLSGIPSDGQQHTISVMFTDSLNCTFSQTFNAPAPCLPCNQTPGNSGPYCSGDTVQLWTDTIPGVTWSWTGPNGFTSNLQNPVINNATTSASGTYTVSVTGACSGTGSTTVVVNSTPQLSLNSFTICQEQIDTLRATVTSATIPIDYFWNNGLGNADFHALSPNITTSYFCVVTDANGCSSDTARTTITVHPPLSLNVSDDINICFGSDTIITANGTGGNGGPYTYTWNNGLPDDTIHTVSPTNTTTYTVNFSDNCSPIITDSVKVAVIVPPTATFVADTLEGCRPLMVDFTYTGDGTMADVYLWNFGDGSTSSFMNPSHYFEEDGCYDITLTTFSAVGNCIRQNTDSCMIQPYPMPVAEFTYSPDNMDTNNPYANFNNLSTGDSQWFWDFDDEEFSYEQAPTHTYQDSGTYQVLLVVKNEYECVDSVINPVRVDLGLNIYVPNSFTPNGDGKNDIFMPVTTAYKFADFNMYIFDRWGGLVYQTKDALNGWNGAYRNSGPVCQTEVYTYKITYKTKESKYKELLGNVNLIK